MKADDFTQLVSDLLADHQKGSCKAVLSTRYEWFCLIATVQLACRHPGFTGATRAVVEHWARHVGDSLGANDPQLRKLIAMGWEKQFDYIKPK